jgi:acyl-[acyl-carrier-protein]-phospholipid O-acyltransferase / long-chain-fatty-acid--[acyl-carrier-protein] ligase
MLPLLRLVNWVIVHLLYRITVLGLDRFPQKGGALLVANHVAFSDPPILLGVFPRLIRFLMYRPYYELPFINFFVSRFKAIPVSEKDGPKQLVKSLNTARDAIKNGEVVGIFAEGALTRLGNMLQFGKGLERIMKGVEQAPILPIHIDAIWGSIFSHRNGKPFRKLPRRIPYPVTVTVGAPLPPTASAFEVRSAIQDLSAEAFRYRTDEKSVLHRAFIRTAQQRLGAECISDAGGEKLSYLKLLVTALEVAGVVRNELGQEKMVGVLIPPSCAGVLANLALMFAGYIPVNLNYTASASAIESAIKQCEITHLLTSKAFTEKLGISFSVPQIYIEELRTKVHPLRLALYTLGSIFLPSRLLEALVLRQQRGPDDLAPVIFSSGSTGEPKGVMLSHRNISSNILGISDVFQVERNDCVVGVLPFFHSFGFTATLWLPLLNGIRATYHTNPVDAATIGDLVQRSQGTLLMGTPSFLLSYLRKCTPQQFKSLRHIMVGAEKLKLQLVEAFYEKFKIRPMEGYGCTELSPVAAVSIRSYEDTLVKQIGTKPGSVGHPIPGVAVRIVDPDTFTPRAPGAEGLLLIKGPNVMLGYLNNPTRTAEVLRDGWYVTGDIARIDEDGFITITDRLSRFSKIGGEMVPHIKIEEEIQAILNTSDLVVAVTAIPHEKKGEQLVVLHSLDLDCAGIVKKLNEKGLPNLWIPKKEAFVKVDQIPLLGSGKLDLRQIKAIALERVKAQE